MFLDDLLVYYDVCGYADLINVPGCANVPDRWGVVSKIGLSRWGDTPV